MKEITDYDLDVMNVFEDFPKDDINCFIYLRSSKKDKEKTDNFCKTSGNEIMLFNAIHAFMSQSDGTKCIVYNAILNYFNEHPEEIKDFIKKASKLLK